MASYTQVNSPQQRTIRHYLSADLSTLHIIKKLKAAGITCSLKEVENGNVMVIDLGTGPLGVSLLTFRDGELKNAVTVVHPSLQGQLRNTIRICVRALSMFQNFREKLERHFISEIGMHKESIASDPRAFHSLRTACERVKRTLSDCAQTSIEVDPFYSGVNFYSSITRVCFEELCEDLFCRIRNHIEYVLRYASLQKPSIDRIVLVGGSTRIPKLRRMVANLFSEEKVSTPIILPDSAVYAAALETLILW